MAAGSVQGLFRHDNLSGVALQTTLRISAARTNWLRRSFSPTILARRSYLRCAL
jgi:hypothetical protein